MIGMPMSELIFWSCWVKFLSASSRTVRCGAKHAMAHSCITKKIVDELFPWAMQIRDIDPRFCLHPDSQIWFQQQQKKEGGGEIVFSLFVAINFTKLEIILIFNRYRKIWANWQRNRVFLSKNMLPIRNMGLVSWTLDPDPQVKNSPDPDPHTGFNSNTGTGTGRARAMPLISDNKTGPPASILFCFAQAWQGEKLLGDFFTGISSSK